MFGCLTGACEARHLDAAVVVALAYGSDPISFRCSRPLSFLSLGNSTLNLKSLLPVHQNAMNKVLQHVQKMGRLLFIR